jgi:hypothetical protein
MITGTIIATNAGAQMVCGNAQKCIASIIKAAT